jgi:plastocyanin
MEGDTTSENPFSRRDVLHLSTATLGSYGFSKTVAAQSENTVRGTVVEDDGDPIEGANVRVPLSDGGIQTTTNAAGVFELEFGDRSVPNTVTVIISAVGYTTESVNVSTSGDEVSVQLSRSDEDVVTISEDIHHLGDGFFSGTINSQFQEPVEGSEFETTFDLTTSQASAQEVKLVYTVRGAQEENEFLINGDLVGVTDISDQDGSASSQSIAIDPAAIQAGTNSFRAVSVATPALGDIDDFEISNIRLSLGGFSQSTFDPDINAFDFTNWPTVSDSDREFFDPPHNHEITSQEEVQNKISESWQSSQTWQEYIGRNEDNPGIAVNSLAPLVYASVNQGSGTAGHCFGMAIAAQEYFDNPDSIPVDVESVDEIPRPTGQYSAVGDDIDFYHNTQFLEFNTFARWKFILTTQSQNIDYDRNLELIRSAIEESGTAVVGVSDGSVSGHQLLVYEYLENGNTLTLKVYDPNGTGLQPEQVAITTGTDVTWRWEGGPYAISIDSVSQEADQFSPGEVIRSDTLTKTVTLNSSGKYEYSATPKVGIEPTGEIRVVEPNEPLPEDFDGDDFTDSSEVAIAVGTEQSSEIQFDSSGSSTTPITNQSNNLYQSYDRLLYLGGGNIDLGGLVAGSSVAFSRGIVNFFSNIASFLSDTPEISFNVWAPDGSELKSTSDDFESNIATEYNEVRYQYNATVGEYDVEVIGEGETEYTVESRVQTANGGFINDSFTDTIQEGESKTLTATVPEQEGEEGSIFALAEFDQDDDGQIGFDDLRYAGREYNRGNITFDQLRRIARAYNTGESV